MLLYFSTFISLVRYGIVGGLSQKSDEKRDVASILPFSEVLYRLVIF